ncbi:MAG: hypothetical protein ACK4MT_03115 [Thermaurantiacus tibetensis]|uniref:phage fiber-tail adaptor protein n=1 Tax=Thermaurantiacus tibetensis TaxID=2759035 RepID=UPI00189037B7|nr:hypothetical protein [Thermaurantiacus tibetensis]
MFLKDPDARLDYRFDWSDWTEGGVALAASEWAVEPAVAGGLVAESPAIEGTATLVWLTGGAPGQVYAVRNRVTFSDGAIDERSIVVRVENR